MDLASVVAALTSVGVRVSGSTPNSSVQVDSSRACPTGLAGPEPSGTINDPGQHFQPLNPVQTREMLQDPRVKVREILLGPLSLVRAEGVATVEVHHPAAVAVDVERATIVWIRSQVQIKCPMRIEITLKTP